MRTHSKPYVVNRTSKHQRTAGFVDQDLDILNPLIGRDSSNKVPINNNILFNGNSSCDMQQQHYQMQQMRKFKFFDDDFFLHFDDL